MVVKDKVVRLSSEVVDLLKQIDDDIDYSVRVILKEDIIKIDRKDVVTKDILQTKLAATSMEIMDKIDSLKMMAYTQ